MKFLLVNDDGFGAEGIVTVEEILKEFGEVYVVAPMEHQSGKGCSIALRSEYHYKKYDDHHYAVDGVPTSCTMFGLNALGIKFDVVVSGCNYGWNLTIDSMYSGTVGACFESLFQRVPAIAVSCQKNFDIVKNELSDVLKYIFNHKLLSNEYLLNVNFPLDYKSKGIKLTSMHQAKVDYHFHLSENGYCYERSGVFSNVKRNTDVYAVKHGYISITPLGMTTYNPSLLRKIKYKI